MMETPSILRNEKPPRFITTFVLQTFSEEAMGQIHRKWNEYKMLHRKLKVPDHDHWNWPLKRATAYNPTIIGLECDEQVQGLMLIDHHPVPGRTPSTANLLFAYVSYVEAAPWNVKAYAGDAVRFLGVGTALMSLAVEVSRNNGWAGRVALHSLPEAHRFYLSQGFTQVGYDSQEDLDYFELSEEG